MPRRGIRKQIRIDLRYDNSLSKREKQYLLVRLEPQADRLFNEAKQASGLHGRAPTIKIGNANRVKGNKVKLDKVTAANLLKIRAAGVSRSVAKPGRSKRASMGLLLHEYAHVGQNRSPGGPPKRRSAVEGYADRYAKILSRRLGIGRYHPTYPHFYRRAKHVPRKAILYGEFKH